MGNRALGGWAPVPLDTVLTMSWNSHNLVSERWEGKCIRGFKVYATVTRKDKRNSFKKNQEKWTVLLMRPGWTVIPNVILERQQALGLDAVDINIILHLARHWWYKDAPPYPSKRTMAECMKVDVSTIRRHIARMEKDGLIKRIYRKDPEKGQKPNEYLFDGLIGEATPYALEAIERKKKREKENVDTRRRKKPLAVLKRLKEDKK